MYDGELRLLTPFHRLDKPSDKRLLNLVDWCVSYFDRVSPLTIEGLENVAPRLADLNRR